MKKLLIATTLFFCTVASHAQDITGQWHGILKVQGMQLRLIFDINKEGDSLRSTLDSPDQNAKDLPVNLTRYKKPTLTLQMKQLGAEYLGTWNSEGGFTGTFYQAGQTFPLQLTREVPEKEPFVRPQEPKKPYPYHSEDVKFPGDGGNIELAGTLTLPKKEGRFPAAILISGSGPQNRDEEFMTHKPFLVLSDHLTRNGIAVLRYDDRGFGASSGIHVAAISSDFANDVQSAIHYLRSRKEIDYTRIGLIGHSEGGLIAPIVAAGSKDVSFMVMLAGPGVPGSQILLQQIELIGKTSGLTEEWIKGEQDVAQGIFDIIKTTSDSESLEARLKEYLNDAIDRNPEMVNASGPGREDILSQQVARFSSPWYRYFVQYDPAASLRKVQCPVLAINGEKDMQVAPENLDIIARILKEGGNKNVTTKIFPGQNHLFQECETGALSEYATIEQTFSPVALSEISSWILTQVCE